ncbi:hypothetical protein BKA70DRAFT_681548 [Coprinopsis sp. MPI-PUGE-AT-0042]|nr:hypothetical protein BKA70DRAFT_681548 [Coprinopsis sp. MPI-PUGE-AT-0042]
MPRRKRNTRGRECDQRSMFHRSHNLEVNGGEFAYANGDASITRVYQPLLVYLVTRATSRGKLGSLKTGSSPFPASSNRRFLSLKVCSTVGLLKTDMFPISSPYRYRLPYLFPLAPHPLIGHRDNPLLSLPTSRLFKPALLVQVLPFSFPGYVIPAPPPPLHP